MPKYYFSCSIFCVETTACLSTSWNAAAQKIKKVDMKVKNVTFKITISDVFQCQQVAFGSSQGSVLLWKMHQMEVKVKLFALLKASDIWGLHLEKLQLPTTYNIMHTDIKVFESASPFQCVDRATAVNHTCSFTDACVGGSESKITERLRECECGTWVSVCGRNMTEQKKNGWKWLCEERRARYFCLNLWSRTLVIAD